MIRQRCHLKDKVVDARYERECVCEDALVHNELVAIKQASLEQAISLLKLHPNADSPWQERRTIAKLLMLPLHPNRSPNGRLPEPKAFREIVRGLHFLHMNGIAHRDVSLENVLLHDRVYNIPDFGFATYVGYLCTEVVGKSYYMTPEVTAGERYAPMPADMQSLGILLFVILTGSPLVQRAIGRNNEFAAFC
ncbi:hypothetical protein JM18_009391 [Phytophthora kernoviae]|uniref:Protein kinase domain-containing protein n=1 Tax=Phytophthora kernoviae TaxID=325452 RepID=A0A921V3S4_9STRA|nr:hypothetical protein JM18_009391 [Phytophthora kernoviae]